MSIKSNTTRKDKIKFLKDLQAGKVTVNDVDNHVITDMWISCNGEHFSMRTGEVKTDKEFEEFKNNPAWLR